MKKLKCDYCGKIKQDFTLAIGGSKKPDWCIFELTGKVACPECYEKALKEKNSLLNQIKNGGEK